MRLYRDRIYARYRSGGMATSEPTRSGDAYLRDVVRKHFPYDRGSTILDIGCGPGHLVRVATSLGYRNVEGVDVSAEQVAAAAHHGIRGVRQAEVLGHLAQLHAETLDVIVAFDLIEHLTKDEAFALAEEVHRTLKQRGRFVLHTANAESPFFGRVRYGDLTHEQAFTSASLQAFFSLVGFSKVTCFEDRPRVHGAASAVRRLVWNVTRTMLVAFLVAESGPDARNAIVSQNLMCVAIK